MHRSNSRLRAAPLALALLALAIGALAQPRPTLAATFPADTTGVTLWYSTDLNLAALMRTEHDTTDDTLASRFVFYEPDSFAVTPDIWTDWTTHPFDPTYEDRATSTLTGDFPQDYNPGDAVPLTGAYDSTTGVTSLSSAPCQWLDGTPQEEGGQPTTVSFSLTIAGDKSLAQGDQDEGTIEAVLDTDHAVAAALRGPETTFGLPVITATQTMPFTIQVTDATGFTTGSTVLIDAEQFTLGTVDETNNTLELTARAQNGTTATWHDVQWLDERGVIQAPFCDEPADSGVLFVTQLGTAVNDQLDFDSDGDGCPNFDELAPRPDATERWGHGNLGSERDPWNFWDYYDVNHNGQISPAEDILPVILAWDLLWDDPGYTIDKDRGLFITGLPHFKREPADGVINVPDDILGVILQYQHNCPNRA